MTDNTNEELPLLCPDTDVVVYCEYGCDDEEDCPFHEKEYSDE